MSPLSKKSMVLNLLSHHRRTISTNIPKYHRDSAVGADSQLNNLNLQDVSTNQKVIFPINDTQRKEVRKFTTSSNYADSLNLKVGSLQSKQSQLNVDENSVIELKKINSNSTNLLTEIVEENNKDKFKTEQNNHESKFTKDNHYFLTFINETHEKNISVRKKDKNELISVMNMEEEKIDLNLNSKKLQNINLQQRDNVSEQKVTTDIKNEANEANAVGIEANAAGNDGIINVNDIHIAINNMIMNDERTNEDKDDIFCRICKEDEVKDDSNETALISICKCTGKYLISYSIYHIKPIL